MGAGNYWAVIYGCPDVQVNGNAKKFEDDKVNEQFEDLCQDLGLNRSYEGSSDYVGVQLLNTLYDSPKLQVPGGVLPIEELSAVITTSVKRGGELNKAVKTWHEFQKKAAKLDLTIPDGQLLWISDYE